VQGLEHVYRLGPSVEPSGKGHNYIAPGSGNVYAGMVNARNILLKSLRRSDDTSNARSGRLGNPE